jgi:RNA polymerase sigma-70 factor (ECF subfamily)
LTTLTFQTRAQDTRLGDPRDDICDFDAIVARHQPQVARLAHRLLGWRDRSAVEDVVQDVFLVALTRLKGFRGDSTVATWLAGITINQCRAHRRRSFLRLKWLGEKWNRHDTNHQPPDVEETSQRVRDAVGRLPLRDREVIVLFYLEDFSVAQIAQLLGVKNNAIEVRLHRARQRLKTQLAGLIGD